MKLKDLIEIIDHYKLNENFSNSEIYIGQLGDLADGEVVFHRQYDTSLVLIENENSLIFCTKPKLGSSSKQITNFDFKVLDAND